jgi:Fic family protein
MISSLSLFSRFSLKGWNISESPKWRKLNCPTTKSMLEKIKQVSDNFEKLPPFIKSQLKAQIIKSEAINFVFMSNQFENVGNQTEGTTEALCLDILDGTHTIPCQDQESIETIQTLKALQWMQNHRDCQSLWPLSSLYTSPDTICELHKVCLDGLILNSGQYRKHHAYPHGYSFCYTVPKEIQAQMLNWSDALLDITFDKTDITFEETFKLAALVMFNFLDVHPFSDGNGRLARILASNIMSWNHFFPVHTQPFSLSGWRQIYLDAITSCRDDTQKKPCDLAALLVESSWIIWCRIEQIIDSTIFLGTIGITNIVRNSSGLQKYLEYRWSFLNHSLREHIPSTYDNEIKHVIEELKKINPGPFQISVQLSDNSLVRIEGK